MTIDLGELSDGQEKDDENKKSGGPGFMTLSYKLQITNYSYQITALQFTMTKFSIMRKTGIYIKMYFPVGIYMLPVFSVIKSD